MTKCLAIADLFINEEMLQQGLATLKAAGCEVDIRTWQHSDLEALQKDNILLEQQGSEAVALPEGLLIGVEQYDFIITQFAPIGKTVIDRAKNLKLIGVLRAGTENIDCAYAAARDITVYNTPGRSKTSVSEYTVGLILAEMRNIARADHKLRQGKWEKYYPNGVLAPELGTATVGLIGYGEIGRAVADLIRPFGSRIIFYDDYFHGETPDTQVSLTDLITQADVISMHYRLTAATRNMINQAHFKQMKPTAIMINSARSGLINESDLITALQKRMIAGAAVDVFDHEPLPANHPYLTLENITLTPHIAGSTIGNFANSPRILAQRIITEYMEERV
jgi:D-3-phosphoglycerate dehydrogenase